MIILTSACHDTYIATIGILKKRNPHVLQRAQEAIHERQGHRGYCQLEQATLQVPAPLGFVSVDKLLEFIRKNRPSCPSLNLCSVALEEEKKHVKCMLLAPTSTKTSLPL